mgnify:FL=1|tara:strand:- start:556 stop:1383 length:828 start_codon:yes stop_codon:yes gene_type:complete
MLENIFRLNDKVIVVTGASGLLGEKHAEAIACYGGTPVLIDLSEDKINKIVEQLNEKYNVNSMGYVVDVTDEEDVKKNVSEVIQKYGKIDGLINNAANNPKVEDSENINFSRLENFPENVWNDDLDVGLKGAFLCAKYYGYEISKNPEGGSILNISSDLGLIAPDQDLYLVEGLPPEKQAVKPVTYSVVKTGIIGLTRYLATYWSKNNVRSNAICPGGVDNNQNEEFISKVSEKIPLGRLANVNEYQGTVVWILSDASSYLNGAIIPIDGGRTAW